MTGPSVLPRFKVGDPVVVRDDDSRGHVRTPAYIRGKAGVVERHCGAFPDPGKLAYGRSGLPGQPLYRVRFAQQDVWPGYGGYPEDTLDIEIFQHWLERR